MQAQSATDRSLKDLINTLNPEKNTDSAKKGDDVSVKTGAQDKHTARAMSLLSRAVQNKSKLKSDDKQAKKPTKESAKEPDKNDIDLDINALLGSVVSNAPNQKKAQGGTHKSANKPTSKPQFLKHVDVPDLDVANFLSSVISKPKEQSYTSTGHTQRHPAFFPGIQGLSREDFERWRTHARNESQSDNVPVGSSYPEYIWDLYSHPDYVTLEIHIAKLSNPYQSKFAKYVDLIKGVLCLEGSDIEHKSLLINVDRSHLNFSWVPYISRLSLYPVTYKKEMHWLYGAEPKAYFKKNLNNQGYWAPGLTAYTVLGSISGFGKNPTVFDEFWVATSLKDAQSLAQANTDTGVLDRFNQAHNATNRELGAWLGQSFEDVYLYAREQQLGALGPTYRLDEPDLDALCEQLRADLGVVSKKKSLAKMR